MAEDYPRGTVIKVAGLGEGVDREALKKAGAEYGEVAWIEYERGQAEALIRFDSSEVASAAATSFMDKTVEVLALPTLPFFCPHT